MVHKLRDIKIVEIKAGRHAAALSQDGKLYIWGPALDPSKPLMEPQELRAEKKISQISVGPTVSALVDETGLTYTWGISNSFGQLGTSKDKYFQLMPELVPDLADRRVRKVSCGQDFCIALGQDCSTGNRIQNSKNPTISEKPPKKPESKDLRTKQKEKEKKQP